MSESVLVLLFLRHLEALLSPSTKFLSELFPPVFHKRQSSNFFKSIGRDIASVPMITIPD